MSKKVIDLTDSDLESFTVKLRDGRIRKHFVTGSVEAAAEIEFLAPSNTPDADFEVVDPSSEKRTPTDFGKAGANKRWKPHHNLVEKACRMAEKLWRNGDTSWHPQMTDKILAIDEFKDLKRYRLAVLKKFGQIAEQFNKKRGLKVKKN